MIAKSGNRFSDKIMRRTNVTCRVPRVVILAGLVLLMPVLGGCESFDVDKLDVFGLNEKKKLPGERKVLFPQGVPGVQQGIPPEFIKGNQPAADATPAAAAPADSTAAADPDEKPKPKPKAKRAAKPAPPPADQQQQQQSAPQQAQAPWPSSPPAR